MHSISPGTVNTAHLRRKLCRVGQAVLHGRMLFHSLLFPGKAVNAAPRMRLNKTAVTLIQGKTVKLRIIGTKRKVTWKSSNKKIAKVNKKGVVKALSPGKCTITAKVRGKKLKCKVTVDTVERINAKKLYDLIRKKGKKGKGEEKNLRTISTKFRPKGTDDSIEVRITAYPEKGKLLFSYDYVLDSPCDSYHTELTMNLLKKKKGTISSSYRDLYVDPVHTHSVNGTISTLYDGKSQGLFLTECYDGADPDETYDDDVETSVPYKGKPRPDDISKGIYRINDAFANYNILLKKYGYSMKKIGFTKWKNTNN